MRARLALRRRLIILIAVTSCALDGLLIRSSRAQSAEAEALFNEGIKLLGEGKVVQACAALDASNRVEARAGTLIRLGECRERNQQLASAWSAYKDALTRVKDPHKREVATARAATLEPRLSYLTVLVPDENRMEGLTLTRNGQPFDPVLWNRGLPVDGSDYNIAGYVPGHEKWQTTVHIATEGAKVSITVPKFKELSKLAQPRSPPSTLPAKQETWVTTQAHEVTAKKPAAEPHVAALETVHLSPRKVIESRPWAAWKPWAVAGAGVGFAAVGGVLHVLSGRGFNAYDSEFLKLSCAVYGCTSQAINEEDPHLLSRLNRARIEQKIAVGGYIAGGVAIAAGVTLLYLNRPHLMRQEGSTPRAIGEAIVPMVSRDMLGILVTISR